MEPIARRNVSSGAKWEAAVGCSRLAQARQAILNIGPAHAEAFGAVRPAATMVEGSRLIEEWMLVEMESDAVIGARA